MKVHYRGTLIDGTEIDSTRRRRTPAELVLGNVIPCWTEGLQMMKVGGKARLHCPSSLAYGDRGQPARAGGRPSIPGGAVIIYDVELIAIAKAAPRD